MGKIITYLILWGIVTGLYLLLAWTVAWPEVGVGMLAAAITVWLAVLVRAQHGHRFKASSEGLTLLKQLPGQVLADSGLIIVALWRCLTQKGYQPGSFRTIPFRVGRNTPEDAARRALVTAGLSFSPNTYTVIIEPEKEALLVHQLVPSDQPPGQGNQEWPV